MAYRRRRTTKSVTIATASGDAVSGASSVPTGRRRRSKYHVDNSPAGRLRRTVDGVLFASQAEADRYVILKLREQAGLIAELALQPSFVLLPGFVDASGKRQRPIKYTADFRYREGDVVVIEEVKGRPSRDFTLRMRLFLYNFPEYVYKLVPAGEVHSYP